MSNSKLAWGRATWYAFHILADRIDPAFFINNRLLFINHIKSICNNLPCPNCAHHARVFMSKVNERNIRNKNDLINMFFVFHNEVNKRIGHPQFKKENLKIYSKMNITKVLEDFMRLYSKKYGNGLYGGFYDSEWQRKQVIKNLTSWLRENWLQFI